MYFTNEGQKENETWQFKITSSLAPISLYFKFGEGANPNEFNYDIVYKNIKPGSQIVFTEK